MERTYFLTLSGALVAVATFTWLRLFLAPTKALYPNPTSDVQDERTASKLLVLTLSFAGLAVALGLAVLVAA